MARGRPKKIKVETAVSEPIPTQTPSEVKVKSEKENLLELYQRLKDLGINSISDLENLIARTE
uniref:Uncharacterized protein n=1 Tax=viral metagenome TaxID=1070528 RepID=A0A6M3JQY5_9ZZZZ